MLPEWSIGGEIQIASLSGGWICERFPSLPGPEEGFYQEMLIYSLREQISLTLSMICSLSGRAKNHPETLIKSAFL